MKLADAEKATANHPPAEERVSMLQEQLARFRREFYGHLTDLRRIAAYEKQHGNLPSEKEASERNHALVEEHGSDSFDARQAWDVLSIVHAKTTSENALDTISSAIEETIAELKKLDPDAR